MKGKVINNYQLQHKLGEGAMGNVYYARHLRTNKEVAVKMLRSELFASHQLRSMFKNEANALIRLIHPNIVRIYDYVEQENYACLIMEYIQGHTLDDYINQVSGPIHAQKATNLMWQVLEGVQYAHDNNIFHRDIKPGNIMVNREGTAAKVMDFGISKLSDTTPSKHTIAGAYLGTPFYMSPEQIMGQPYTIQGDIYSLGVSLFEMVTGKCPYTDTTSLTELHTKIINEPLPSTNKYYPGVPTAIQQAIIVATSKSPGQRFRSCKEFRDHLFQQKQPALSSEPLNPVTTSATYFPVSRFFLIGSLAVILLLAAFIWARNKKNQTYDDLTAASKNIVNDQYYLYDTTAIAVDTMSMITADTSMVVSAYNSADIDSERIKADLLGESILGWRIDYLSEINNIYIENVEENGSIKTYLVQLGLQGYSTNSSIYPQAQLSVSYYYNGSAWVYREQTTNSISITYIAPVDEWYEITPLSNTTYNISNRNRFWITDGNGTNYKGGLDGESYYLTSRTIYITSREPGPVELTFTFRPR